MKWNLLMQNQAHMLILIKHKNEGPNFKVGDNVRISNYKSYISQKR